MRSSSEPVGLSGFKQLSLGFPQKRLDSPQVFLLFAYSSLKLLWTQIEVAVLDSTMTIWVGFLAMLITLVSANAASQQVKPTKVVLDPSRFGSDYQQMQFIADWVSSNVDALIPGGMGSLEQDTILCYQTRERPGALPVPVTISKRYRLLFEPDSVVPGTVRIAVNSAPNAPYQFAYQIAHELAHVKMGPDSDNYLFETFAVAVSYKALTMLDSASYPRSVWLKYVSDEVTGHFQSVSAEMQHALSMKDFQLAKRLWQQQAEQQGARIDDRGFQTYGALLLLTQGTEIDWSALLGIASRNLSDLPPIPLGECAIRSPVLPNLKTAESLLMLLGYE